MGVPRWSLPERIREFARGLGDSVAWVRLADDLEAAFIGFFGERQTTSAEEFHDVYCAVVALWCLVSGEDPGQDLDVEDWLRLRRAALAIKAPKKPGAALH